MTTLGNGEFEELVRDLAEDPRCQKMKEFLQHSDVTTFEHCMDVAKKSFVLARKMHLRVDEKALVVGAFLHDYYLYDWHDYGDKLHGYHHADRALINAKRDFEIGETEESIIFSHMWPLNLTRVPSTKEAFVVCMVDKWVSTKETLKKYKKKDKNANV